jgi:hypothetical protein
VTLASAGAGRLGLREAEKPVCGTRVGAWLSEHAELVETAAEPGGEMREEPKAEFRLLPEKPLEGRSLEDERDRRVHRRDGNGEGPAVQERQEPERRSGMEDENRDLVAARKCPVGPEAPAGENEELPARITLGEDERSR